jgi:hypothetical protein
MNKKNIAFLSAFVLLTIAAGNASAACKLVSGKTYYTDGVSYFKDSACRQEITGNELTVGSAIVSGATANCRFNLTKSLYTDGVAFFTDARCLNEATGGETVSAPTTATAAASAGVQALSAQTQTINNTQLTQIAQRLDALEKKVAGLQSIISQIFALLLKK